MAQKEKFRERNDPKEKANKLYALAYANSMKRQEPLVSRKKHMAEGNVVPIRRGPALSTNDMYQNGNNWNINNEIENNEYRAQREQILKNILFNSGYIDHLSGGNTWLK